MRKREKERERRRAEPKVGWIVRDKDQRRRMFDRLGRIRSIVKDTDSSGRVWYVVRWDPFYDLRKARYVAPKVTVVGAGRIHRYEVQKPWKETRSKEKTC